MAFSSSTSALRRILALWLWPSARDNERVAGRLIGLSNDLGYDYPTVRAVAAWVFAPTLAQTSYLDRALQVEAQDDAPEIAARLLDSAVKNDVQRLCSSSEWKNVEPVNDTLQEVKDLRSRYEQLLKITGFKR